MTNLAILYARKGDRDRARDLVDNVLASMSDRETVEAARAAVQASTGAGAAVASPAPSGSATSGTESPGGVETTEPLTTSTVEYNRQVAVYNQAVERANRRDYKGAIEILENLSEDVKDDGLREQITKFLEALRTDAARQPKTRG